jgi:uncharacterized protein (DUF2147 family)
VVSPAGRDSQRGGGGLPLTRERRSAWLAASVLSALVLSGPAGAQPRPSPDVAGTWLTEGGRSQVRIAPCGGARCGTIIWTKAEVKDVNNPDPGRRTASLVGLQMIRDARQTADGWTGSLYNPLDGRTYTGRMRLLSATELELSGCVLAGLICKSQTWTRLR